MHGMMNIKQYTEQDFPTQGNKKIGLPGKRQTG
jgi:hypothetical protein